MTLKRPIPVFRMFSAELAKLFYVDFLGFQVEEEHHFGENFPLCMQVKRDNLVLHLSEHFGDASPGRSVFVPVTDIQIPHQELQAKDYQYAKPSIQQLDWGVELQLSDPFSNKIRFCQYAG